MWIALDPQTRRHFLVELYFGPLHGYGMLLCPCRGASLPENPIFLLQSPYCHVD